MTYEEAYRNTPKAKIGFGTRCANCHEQMYVEDLIPSGVQWNPWVECPKCKKGIIITIDIKEIQVPR